MPIFHEEISSLAGEVGELLDFSRSALIYAPNTIGKTRLAQHLKARDPDGVVLYNSFVEDGFTWDNEQVVLKMNPTSDLLDTIVTQGLDSAIVDNFKAFTDGKIEPNINFENNEITFGIHKGDDSSTECIKISRAEESIFVWSVYYAVLNEAIETLRDSPELRSTTDYDQLTLAVIDDPVSSMDDVRIVSVALAISELIKRASEVKLKFVVATHHTLFFNVIFNSIRRKSNKAYVLQYDPDLGWSLKNQSHDSPFSYHLEIIENIKVSISENSVDRVHFNQFRALLEKTANFLGYVDGWKTLLRGPDAVLLKQLLNLYSHDRFSDLDTSEVATKYKEAFAKEFQEFLKTYGWAVAE